MPSSLINLHCENCSTKNENFSIVKMVRKPQRLLYLKLWKCRLFRTSKQRFYCKSCDSHFTAKSNIVDAHCFISNKTKLAVLFLDQSNKDRVKDGLNDINNDIKERRSRWLYICRCYDYLLREGLEVLLVIMTLTTMTRKVKDNKGTASVIGGSILGLILSITCS